MFYASPAILIDSINFLEPHRCSKRCTSLHKSNLWKILDTDST